MQLYSFLLCCSRSPSDPNHVVYVKLMTSENEKSHGSLILRIGAIFFGLGTLIYAGLEFLTFFEVWSSDCLLSSTTQSNLKQYEVVHTTTYLAIREYFFACSSSVLKLIFSVFSLKALINCLLQKSLVQTFLLKKIWAR